MSLSNKMAKANYMGDPGLFGDIWGGIKKIGRVATGVVGGLGIPIVSGVARTAGGILFGGSPRNVIPGASTFPSMPSGLPISMATTLQGYAPPGVAQGVSIGQRFRTAGQALVPGGVEPFGMQAGPAMSGYHWNKSGYFLMDGTYIPPGSKLVKNRKRNPGNMRALSRSLGRIKSAKKMAAVLGTVTIRKTC